MKKMSLLTAASKKTPEKIDFGRETVEALSTRKGESNSKSSKIMMDCANRLQFHEARVEKKSPDQIDVCPLNTQNGTVGGF